MGRHGRSLSFHEIDCEQASGILSDVLKEADVFLGGCSIGKGLKKAASYYLNERSVKNASHLLLPGAKDLALDGDDQTPTEEAFYIVDLGVVVSQVYQCKFTNMMTLSVGVAHSCLRANKRPCAHPRLFHFIDRASLLSSHRTILRRQVQPRPDHHQSESSNDVTSRAGMDKIIYMSMILPCQAITF
jgi:hypothetical protein